MRKFPRKARTPRAFYKREFHRTAGRFRILVYFADHHAGGCGERRLAWQEAEFCAREFRFYFLEASRDFGEDKAMAWAHEVFAEIDGFSDYYAMLLERVGISRREGETEDGWYKISLKPCEEAQAETLAGASPL